ncbi:MAG: hypothetical protein NT120_02855 [Candidatus Aenigmarchaeota archaeon]|nr:hypothetical protein [Candidatus Aenigmarchaeota archaeon]
MSEENQKQADASKMRQSTFQYRRMPAVPRKINEIVPEKDIRVRLLGRVIDKQNSMIVIDDGTATAEIITENMGNVENNDIVRVFCRVLPLETGYELRAEIVQDMKGMDMDLYRKIHE